MRYNYYRLFIERGIIHSIQLNDVMFGKAEKYLRDPKTFLSGLVTNMGYDTCHKTVEYDAKVCETDCKQLEKSQFAEDCRKKNGLFKCCIRC